MAGVEDALRVGVVDQGRGGEREGVEDAERQLGRCFSRGRAGHVALLFWGTTCPLRPGERIMGASRASFIHLFPARRRPLLPLLGLPLPRHLSSLPTHKKSIT